ncbi:asparagine synthase (glutamine-hydrolyzing) [Actinoplanes teichomyceticus]|uniref:asparagine synthase (glutamine-hydrolyzing) n=1 Tax=Actinoplanes teichomyceticus TaxID=1867 RepID=A0A561WK48_ACTTI|nr:asparagine synthase (glutamine-hydrolyzing) [Actinoplanes teichomyceticus]TWG24203.1 asparagine synthase (glutamine-hydrolysing) [Actinoplanes teichomyceticus]GIF12950.1 asparagine synthetase B [Actinoplanes teichomyceticus]
MCGLCGTFAPAGVADRGVAAAMHTRLVHRGPDETYSLSTPVITMKLGRLGMTGLRDGWQPAEDRSGRFVAMTNGEIYNEEELRRHLGLAGSENRVDVSVIPELFARYGPAGLERIDGQFATAVFDRAESALYLGRDRFGICPMYYTTAEGQVHFCSELKPLVTSVPRQWRVDAAAVDQYLSLGNIVAPRTLVRDVCAVRPGCVVRFGAGEPHTVRYWRYGDFATGAQPAPAEEIRDVVRGAVRDRLRADVEIGAYLSGGFDSSTLVMEASAVREKPPRTFSVVFDDAALDEDGYQRAVSEAVRSEHHRIRCRPADVAAQFEQMVRHCCYPQRETYNVAALMLSREVALAGLKGVISGEGADELFFGYDSYAFDGARRRPRPARAENEQAWGRADFSWEVDWDRAAHRRQMCLSAATRDALHGREFWRERLIPLTDAQAAALTPMQLRSVADVYVQLGGHLLGDHGDTALMANSVEGRYPFLGNAVVDLGLRTADADKVADFEGKACLKAAYAGIVPRQVVSRAKQGFTAYGLDAISDERTLAGWRDLVAASGVFTADVLGALAADRTPDKWDVRLSVISISMVIDELGLTL